MNCADIEDLICDYVDGTLDSARKAELESHLEACPACAELAEESAAAVAFMERAADVEPPPELITRILFDAPWRKTAKPQTGVRKWINAALAPVLQPRFVMGMAMTVLSFSVLFTAVKPLKPADFEPAKVWAGLEDRATRAWARTEKFYDNLKVVYQIQTMLHEWQQQDEEQQRPASQTAPVNAPDEHKLPTRAIPETPR